MEVFEAIEKRRSIRRFLNNPVSKETMLKLIRAATFAPSEGNLQPWRFIITDKKSVKRELVSAALGQDFIEEAPWVIVVCADLKATSPYGQRGRNLYCIQSTSAAIQNILLTAHSIGLGTCWVGAFKEEMVCKVLNLPGYLRPVAIIPVGYPAEEPTMPSRYWIEDVIEWR